MNGAQAEQWRPMETAPKDGTIVRLLVDYRGEEACHPLEDAAVMHTIGGNTDGNTGLREGWKFAGWSWEQDCFCEGRGKPIGWLPLCNPSGVAPTPELSEQQITAALEAAGWFDTPQSRKDFKRAFAAAISAGVALRHSTKENGDCPHWCKACKAEEAARGVDAVVLPDPDPSRDARGYKQFVFPDAGLKENGNG